MSWFLCHFVILPSLLEQCMSFWPSPTLQAPIVLPLESALTPRSSGSLELRTEFRSHDLAA